MDTKLNTGPGVWELRAKGQLRDVRHKVVSTTRAIPTPTHMMFVKLQQVNLIWQLWLDPLPYMSIYVKVLLCVLLFT